MGVFTYFTGHRTYRAPRVSDWQSVTTGVEDPRIAISVDSTYVMTYRAYDGKTARLSRARPCSTTGRHTN